MLYEAVSRVIGDMCVRLGVPLTVRSISLLLDNAIHEALLEAACQRMVEEGKLIQVDKDSYTTRNMRFACRVNLLISREYQRLGMTLLHTDEDSEVRYIPAGAEHRFFEVKPSSIGAHAGLGLFLRSSRRVPQGCVLCEYRGRTLTSAASSAAKGVYVVRVRSSGMFIDGVTATGEHLSLATFINDHGPLRANAQLMEYDSTPEIFVVYGATYWGFSSYEELKEHLVPPSTPVSKATTALSQATTCRRCGEVVPWRALRLHSDVCGDPLTSTLLLNLDCLPRSEYTAVCTAGRILAGERVRAFHKATSLVSLSDPQTLAHTFEDIVQDLEFCFTDDAEGKGSS
ncbi:hypothetical protein CGC20_18675 [Leishmania donovani]|uniref:Uncharacterized protein n=1 Tax=Leishmania donovani TaxID=5661 RepID=A0A504XQ50_LEIDO|nr:hypothetical protein CGC20_18675 [Leishmania donovani]